jgi:glycosyltransferase involved in cell wall biosynthesis
LLGLSTTEGFGLPLVEAASHGLPLVVRDIPVFREVCGQGAYFFPGTSPQDLCGALQLFMAESPEDRKRKVSQVPLITWDESARKLLHALAETGADVSDWIA